MKILSLKKIYFFLIFATLSTYAQSTIRGAVTDLLTNDQLKGAEIILTGTNFYAVSNIDGEFRITEIPPGDYILVASYFGFKEKRYSVNIKSEEILNLNIELLPHFTTGDEAVLGDLAKSQAEKINLQIKSSTIKSIISGKKLHEMPDENIPIALNRLPGVSIMYTPLSFPSSDRSVWELKASEDKIGILFPPLGNFTIADDPFPRVLIRGLDSRFSNITINRIRISPTSAKDMSLDLRYISGRCFQNIELRKTITSDEDADATAGAITIVTKKAPFKRIMRADLLGAYNTLDKSANQYNFTGSYSERFFNKLLGIQVDANVEKKILSSEYEYISNGLFTSYNTSYSNAVKEKKAVNILLDFVTPDDGSIKFNYIFNENNCNYFDYVADSTFSTIPRYIFSDKEIRQRILISSIEGNHNVYGFNINWNTAFSESRNDNPFNYSLNFFGPPKSSHLDQDFNLSHSVDNPSKNYSKEKTMSIDFSKKFYLSKEIISELKFGGKYRTNSRFYDEDLRAENASLLGDNQYIKLADGFLVKKDFSGTRFNGLVGKSKQDILLSYFLDDPPGERFLFDKYELPLINNDALKLWRQLNYNEYYSNDGVDINSYNFSERIYAGYLMHNLNFGQWAKFITGFRIESEYNNFTGYYFPNTLTDGADLYNGVPKKTNNYHYNKVAILPNFHIILQPSDFLNLRLAVYKTLIRPDYYERIPKLFTAFSNGVRYISMGNPDLKNADVWNYEFQMQFYGNDVGQFSINTFYKDIKGMQQAINGNNLSGINPFELLGINWSSFPINFPFSNSNNYSLYTFFNLPKPTRIWGFEVEHLANFRYFPGLFKNFILNYNLTFLRSETWTFDFTKSNNTMETILIGKKQKMVNVPEFFANVTLGYYIKGFSFRISYFYQDSYPIKRNDYRLLVLKNNLSRLDIAAKQQILEKIFLILNLNNITDSKEQFLYKNLPEEFWKTAQTYKYGFNVAFGVKVVL